jgi:NAD(P)-dependent dehydrogenase (short-subunit alcohol dehydrogenase family)
MTINSPSETHPILTQTNLSQDTLAGKVAVVSGAGGGIGFEAARSLLWLGAAVVIAEIDWQCGRNAEQDLAIIYGPERIKFIRTNVGKEASVRRLARKVFRYFGKVDILINNATIAPLGLIKNTPIEVWDNSYKVNLRGPVLLIQAFLPGMLDRDDGIIVNISSTGTAFMGAYETYKAALVHLTQTLEAELDGTGLFTFTIGPGLVPTETATHAVETLAPQLGMSLEAFYQANAHAMLSVEEAGAGYAAAIVKAKKFHGQEISCLQALHSVEYGKISGKRKVSENHLTPEKLEPALRLAERVRDTFIQQTEGWKMRSLFERQWMLRDFKKNAGMPVEAWLDQLDQLVASLNKPTSLPDIPLLKLSSYYDHLAELAKGYEKDPDKLKKNLEHIYSWRDDIITLAQIIADYQS